MTACQAQAEWMPIRSLLVRETLTPLEHSLRKPRMDGMESALEKARAAAGEKDIVLNSVANAAQQYLKAGLLDEINLYLVRILLGEDIPWFKNIGTEQIKREKISVTEAPGVTHFRFRVVR